MDQQQTESLEERQERFCHTDLQQPLIKLLFEFQLPVPNNTPDE
ncbi:hypothetical protein [Methylophaga lonarensis]|nr:hypothetical protein [Methylophaga lonarensis]